MKHGTKAALLTKNRAAYSLIVIMLVLILFGIFQSFQNPTKEQQATDSNKVYDLYTIQGVIQKHYKEVDQHHLPDSLAEIRNLKLRGDVSDYQYKAVKNGDINMDYELCVTFASDGKPLNPNGFTDYSDHKKGYQCFSLNTYQTNITRDKYGIKVDYPAELDSNY